MHSFTSTASPKPYLSRELPVYLRVYSHHQGHDVTCSAARAQGDPDFFLVPHASVIAAHRIEDPTSVIEVSVGERFKVDGVEYQVRDDKPLHNPRLVAIRCATCGDVEPRPAYHGAKTGHEYVSAP